MSTSSAATTVSAVPASRADPAPSFRPDIQGLRALAVTAVVLYHAGVPILHGGFVGVDVFFVVSGFLITGLLWRELEAEGRLGLARFYARRARRLLPAAVLVLVVGVATAHVLLPPLRVAGVARDAAAAALYSANYRFAAQGTNYLGGSEIPSPFQHYWSLGVEEQFYLVLPVLLVLAVRLRRPARLSRADLAAGLVVVAAGSVLLSVHLTRTNQPWAFYSLPTRAWELAAGGLVALGAPTMQRLPGHLRRGLGWAGGTALAVAAVGFGTHTAYPGTAALLPVGGTVAVLTAGAYGTPQGLTRVLAHRSLQPLGAMSYSWYLWHWPVLVLGALVWTGPAARALFVVLGAGLAALTYVAVEDPVRRAPRLARSPASSLTVGAALTAASLALALMAAALVPPVRGGAAAAAAPVLSPASSRAGATVRRLDPLAAVQQPVIAAAAAAVPTRAVPSNLTPALEHAHADKAEPFVDGCDLAFTASVSPPCVYGDASSRFRVVAFGDSHAAQWFPALSAAAEQQHWRLENLTKATCPPFPLPLFSPALGREFRECEQWRASTLDRILAEKPSLVVVDVARHYGPEYGFTVGGAPWVQALGALTSRIRSAGIAVLVLGPTPRPPGDVPDCLSEHLTSVPECGNSRSEAVDAPTVARERAAVTSAGARYLDVAPWICTADRCATIVGNLLVFRDDNHVTTSFARWLTPVFAVAVQEFRRGRT